MLFETLQTALKADKSCFNMNKTVAEENKRVFRLDLSKGEPCCLIHVDGCLIKANDVEKCDYWFHHCDRNDNIFVELKGQNIRKGFQQILSTIDWLKSKIDLPKEKRNAAIVASKVPMTSAETQKLKIEFKSKYGNRLEIQSIQMVSKFP